MSIQKPGEMRCPTCGRSTPIAPFCSHCGATMPSDAPIRPRGMDRDELDERIRQSREEHAGPFRRGTPTPGPGEPAGGFGPEAFVPEPEDRLLRAEQPAPEQAHIDHFDDAGSTGWGPPLGSEAFEPEPARSAEPAMPEKPAAREQAAAPEPEWPREASWQGGAAPDAVRRMDVPVEDEDADEGAAPASPAISPTPSPPVSPAPAPPVAGPSPVSRQAEPRYEAPEYREPEPVETPFAGMSGDAAGGGYGGGGIEPGYGYGDEPPRRGGSSPLAIVGVLVLAVAALLGGALLYGILTGPSGTASASPTPTASSTPTAFETGTPLPTTLPSGGASETPGVTESPGATGTPVPDNFTAKVQPCATSDMGFQGCAEDGTTITGTRVWVWVGFYQAQYNDVIGVTLLQGGSSVADGSIQLQQDNIGCKPDKTCTGYLNFNFGALDPGDYTIQVSRNGSDAAEASFTVS